MAAAKKKTPDSVQKASREPRPTPNPEKQARLKENLQNRVFLELIKDYTHHQDWEMVEDIFDVYGRVLSDRENGR